MSCKKYNYVITIANINMFFFNNQGKKELFTFYSKEIKTISETIWQISLFKGYSGSACHLCSSFAFVFISKRNRRPLRKLSLINTNKRLLRNI